jgi:hypothetical protein
LFSADSVGNLEPCLADLEERVSGTMNDDFMKTFIAEEVSFVLHQMGLLKASSLDGVSMGFFQNHWDIVGDEVCQAVLDTLNYGIMPTHLNMTHIVLIPKVKTSCVT